MDTSPRSFDSVASARNAQETIDTTLDATLDQRAVRALRIYSLAAAFIVLLLGVVVLVAWLQGWVVIKSLNPGWISMKPITALCLALAGLSILFYRWRRRFNPHAPPWHLLPVAVILLIALVTLVQYLFNVSLPGFDTLLFRAAVLAEGQPYPGRMAATTAFAFGMFGAAMLLAGSRRFVLYQQCAAGVVVLAWLSLISYVFGATDLYSNLFFGAIALHTSIALLLLGTSLFAQQPDRGVMLFLTRQSTGRAMLLRLWLITLGLTLVIGWLTQLSYREGQLNETLGIALLTGATAVVFTVLIGWSAVALQKSDRDREGAHRQLHAQQERLRNLQTLTAALSEAATSDRIVKITVDLGAAALGAGGGVAALVTADGCAREIVYAIGYSTDVVERARYSALDAGATPLSDAIRRREAIWVDNLEVASQIYPHLASSRGGYQAWAVLPLVVEGRVLGALDFAFRSPRLFQSEDRIYMQTMAGQCAQALARAKLYDAEKSARAAAAESARAATFLATASQVLSNPLSVDDRLDRVAALLVPALADWCTVNMLDADGGIRLAAVAHTDPGKAEWIREWTERYPIRLDSDLGMPRVLRTGQSSLRSHMTPETYEQLAEGDPDALRYWQASGAVSLMTVAMVARDRTLGAMTLASTQPDRLYGSSDVALAEELARRAGLAIDNAQLYASEQHAREQAERDAARTRVLQAVTAMLSTALTPQQVTQVVVEQGVAGLGARSGFVTLFEDVETSPRRDSNESDATVFISADHGFDPDVIGSWRRYLRSVRVPITTAINTGQPVWIESRERLEEMYPDAAQHTESAFSIACDDQAWVALPLQYQGRTMGALGLSFAQRRRFSEEDQALIIAIAQQCAQALERARLFVAERKLNQDLEQRVVARTMELEQSNAQLRESREQLRDLSGQIMAVVEEERTRIAREVHDELGQALTSMKMTLTMANRRLATNPAYAEEAIKATIATIDETIQTVRRIATDLRPGVLDDLGLQAAIEWQVKEFARRTGVPCRFISEMADVPEGTLNPQISTAAFRILQEALTNVTRHAEASAVHVTLEANSDELLLNVRDDGKGISGDPNAHVKTFGLLGMRERALRLNGRVDIASAPGQGTTVAVRIPLGQP